MASRELASALIFCDARSLAKYSSRLASVSQLGSDGQLVGDRLAVVGRVAGMVAAALPLSAFCSTEIFCWL